MKSQASALPTAVATISPATRYLQVLNRPDDRGVLACEEIGPQLVQPRIRRIRRSLERQKPQVRLVRKLTM